MLGENEKCPCLNRAVMKQTKSSAETSVPMLNENISIPYGLVKTVEHYLDSAGVLELTDTLKERGVPMGRIVVAMCTYILIGNNSMTRCSDRLLDPNVRKEIGIDGILSQRTIDRALNILESISRRSSQHFGMVWIPDMVSRTRT